MFMKKGRRMNLEVRRIVENRKGRHTGIAIESDKKEEITSTEFLEVGNTIYTKRTHQHLNRGYLDCILFF